MGAATFDGEGDPGIMLVSATGWMGRGDEFDVRDTHTTGVDAVCGLGSRREGKSV